MISFMQAFDVIICPVVSSHAPHHGFSAENSKESVYTYVMPYSLVGWPCVVVRAGTSSHGMPIAVQIIARPFREDVALAVAKFIETNLGGWIPPRL